MSESSLTSKICKQEKIDCDYSKSQKSSDYADHYDDSIRYLIKLQDYIEDLKTDNQLLKVKLNSFINTEREVSELKTRFDAFKEERKTEKENLLFQIEYLKKNQNSQDGNQFKDLSKENEKLKQQNSKLTKEKESADKRLTDVSEDYNKIKNDYFLIKKANETFEKELKDGREAAKINKDITVLKDIRIKSFESEQIVFKDKIKEFELKLKTISDNEHKKSADNLRLQHENRQLKNELTNKEDHIKKLLTDYQDACGNLVAKNNLINELNLKLDQSDKFSQEYMNEIKDLKFKLKSVDELKEELSKLKATNATLCESNNRLQMYADLDKEDLNKLKEKLDDLQKKHEELKILKGDLELALSDRDHKIEKLNSDLLMTKLNEQLKAKKNELSQQKINELEQKINEQQNELKDLKALKEKLEEELNGVKTQLDHNLNVLAHAQKVKNSLEEKYDRQASQIYATLLKVNPSVNKEDIIETDKCAELIETSVENLNSTISKLRENLEKRDQIIDEYDNLAVKIISIREKKSDLEKNKTVNKTGLKRSNEDNFHEDFQIKKK